MKPLFPTGASSYETTIPALLLNRVRRTPKGVAFLQKRSGTWRSVTWREYCQQVCALVTALQAAGIERGDRVGILGDASQEWLIADASIMSAGAITVGIYFTSSSDEIDYYLRDSGAEVLFVGGAPQLDALLKTTGARTLRKIVVLGGVADLPIDLDNVVRIEDFVERFVHAGLDVLERASALGKPEDLASIGYTSGTTGFPKGAVLSHKCMLAGAQSVMSFCPGLARGDHRAVVHLPMNHTVARTQALTLPLIASVVPYFGETTADFSATIIEVKPTFYMAPPRFYQRFAAQLLTARNKTPTVSYSAAMAISRRFIESKHSGSQPSALVRFGAALARRAVFSKLLREVGFDKLKHPYTASAPMPEEVMKLWQVWGLNLKECYGQTEMVGANLAQLDDWSRPGTVGSPIPNDAWRTSVCADGEMRVQGPGVLLEYWNRPSETASAIQDGWLMTGDIVEVQSNGSYKLVDRKKDIINTSGGKTVSPTQIENELRKSPYISEAAVVGEGKKYLAALIEVDAQRVSDWATDSGVTIGGYLDFSRSEAVIRLIEGEVAKANKSLARAEQIKGFRILPEELSPDTGVLTATRKKRRKPIADRYQALIASLYEDGEEVLIKSEIAGGQR